jgi:hypothetical protein
MKGLKESRIVEAVDGIFRHDSRGKPLGLKNLFSYRFTFELPLLSRLLAPSDLPLSLRSLSSTLPAKSDSTFIPGKDDDGIDCRGGF